jgi:restriction system protein
MEVPSMSPNVNVRQEWMTPGGKRRSAPMYVTDIFHFQLGTRKTIKGRTKLDVENKALEQLRKWDAQHEKEQTQSEAERLDHQARQRVAQFRSILEYTLDIDDRIDWNELVDRSTPQPFEFNIPKPAKPDYPAAPVLPPPVPMEWLKPGAKARRQEHHRQRLVQYKATVDRLEAEWEERMARWSSTYKQAKEQHRDYVDRYNEYLLANSERVKRFRRAFEGGHPAAIIEYIQMVFERSSYPDDFDVAHEVSYDPAQRSLGVRLDLMSFEEFPTEAGYKVNSRTKEVTPIPLKKRELTETYNQSIGQTIVRTIHEVFEAIYTPHVQNVIVNGFVTTTDAATGHVQEVCLVAVETNKETFEALKLESIDAIECLKHLGARFELPLTKQKSVTPHALPGSSPQTNDPQQGKWSVERLLQLTPDEFEQLIGKLLNQMFPHVHVEVTGKTGDGGIDALVTDPNPLIGGKTIIQAKRYSSTVAPTAVRDLYGTLIDSGANTAVLVTTSTFGPSSWRFVRDKPMSLINGTRFVELLIEHDVSV